MRIHELAGKTVCVLGYGKEGKATVKALEQFAPSAEITIADKNADVAKDSDAHWWQLGEGWLENLRKFDVIIKSPGVPLTKELEAHRSKLTSSVQIFLDSIAGTGAIVVGVTGSKGKSTTSSLIAAILKEAGRDTHLVGNIGDPSIAHLAQAKKDTIFIHELSSYQLQTLTASPHIAVAVSFFPEHLDVHGTVEAYLDAKKNICRFQTEDDRAYFNADAPGAVSIAAEGQGRKIPVTVDDAPVRLNETNLLGEHNLANIALAWKVCEDLGVRKETVIAALKKFQPLPHRLQKLGIVGGIEWIDDAISTTPESAIAALDALGDRVRTIILGGQDRGLDFTGLAKRLKNSSIITVLLFPGSGPRIREAIEAEKTDIMLVDVSSMEDAVRLAQEHTPQGMIVLLSTASPSYGMFKNFEEKGAKFAECVSSLQK